MELEQKAEYKAILEAFERGNDESAKTQLAWYKLSGIGGCEIDTNGAVELLEERVKANDTEAMWILGICNEFGRGCEQNIERAEELYCESCSGKNCCGVILYLNGKEEEEEEERGSGYLKLDRL